MTIPTAASLRKTNRKLVSRTAAAAAVLESMRRGAALHLHYQNGQPTWRLSTGRPVTHETATRVIVSENVVSVGDSLFPGCCPSQTWRYE
jgi:hypothetical protein